jgi:hypothetical protein
MSFTITPTWKSVTPELTGELRDFWVRNKAFGKPDQAELRAAQAVCVGRDADGAVCAVGTAVVRTLPRLRQPTYYYRQFFDAAQRGQRQTVPFAARAKAVLQDYNAALPAPESLGMLVELESKLLAGRYNKADEAGYTFIGYSPRNLPLFVSYFEGATLLPPGNTRQTNTGNPQ